MPTAGEARLARNATKCKNERSSGKASSKSHAVPVKGKKSGLPRPVTKGRYGKENTEPANTKKQAARKVKAKPAPDFSKLHSEWNNQLQKGKAVTKKPNTKVNAFVLTGHNGNRNHAGASGFHGNQDKDPADSDDDVFEVDNNALQGILNNTGIQFRDLQPQNRATIAAPQISVQNGISSTAVKRTSIYYMGEKQSKTHQQTGLAAARAAIATPKRVAWADQNANEDDEISFKPDSQALQSILSDTGVDERRLNSQGMSGRHTLASTRLAPGFQGSLARQSFMDSQIRSNIPSTVVKRMSIYYTGEKQSKTHQQTGLAAARGAIATPKRVAWTDKNANEDDEISFKPDSQALQSILSETGVDERRLHSQGMSGRYTLASTRLAPGFQGSLARQSFMDSQASRRTSIYYTGSKSRASAHPDSGPSLTGSSRVSVISKSAGLPHNVAGSRSSVLDKTADKPYDVAGSRPSVMGKPADQQPSDIADSRSRQYVAGSTVVGLQGDEKPSTRLEPQVAERSKQVHEKPWANSTNQSTTKALDPLMTPCRGNNIETRPQSVQVNRPQPSWEDILTPHRGNTKVVPGSTRSVSRAAQLYPAVMSPVVANHVRPTWPVPVSSPPEMDIAQKLFTDDDIPEKDMINNEVEMEEFERQALEDLKQLELEEQERNNHNAMNEPRLQATCHSIQKEFVSPVVKLRAGNLESMIQHTPQRSSNTTRQNSLAIGTHLISSEQRIATKPQAMFTKPLPPRHAVRQTPLRCEPQCEASIQSQSAVSDLQSAATPQHAVRDALCHSSRTDSLNRGELTRPGVGNSTPARFLTTTPLRTPLKSVLVERNAGEIPFGLLSSVKKSSSSLSSKIYKRIGNGSPLCKPSACSMAWADAICSSTPACSQGPLQATTFFPTTLTSDTTHPHTLQREVTNAHDNIKNSCFPSSHVPENDIGKRAAGNTESPAASAFNSYSVRSSENKDRRRNQLHNSNTPQRDIAPSDDLSLRSSLAKTRDSCLNVTSLGYNTTNTRKVITGLERRDGDRHYGAFKPPAGVHRPFTVPNVPGNSMSSRSPIQVVTSLTELALLDAEVTLYSSLGKRIKTREPRRELTNPLVKLFNSCDPQHIVPVCECKEKGACATHPFMDLL